MLVLTGLRHKPRGYYMEARIGYDWVGLDIEYEVTC